MGNLSETSGALRKFCLKFGNGFSCRTPMKKAHVVVFRFPAAKRKAGPALLAMQMGFIELRCIPCSSASCDGCHRDLGCCVLARLMLVLATLGVVS